MAVPLNQNKPLLEMRALTQRFSGILALSDVNFEVRQDEVILLANKQRKLSLG
jgi:ABC-type branched-subunit amino acid transport system ATPase component